MIRRIRLKNWRAYDALDLELAAGTTFVVASNGVGKTSLVYALSWAIFGEHSGIDARTCIRAGTDRAQVEVEILLADSRELVITREVASRGRARVRCQLDKTEVDEERIESTLASSFGVDLDVAARLSLMLGSGQSTTGEELDLKAHLYKTFGAADLLATAELARKVAKDAEKRRASIRATTDARLADRTKVEEQLAEMRSLVDQLRETGLVLQKQLETADRVRRLAAQIAAQQEQYRRYEQDLDALLNRAATAGITRDHDRMPRDLLAQRLLEAHGDLNRMERESADSRAVAMGACIAASEALRLLSAAKAHCPTCMRAIDSHELASAVEQHEGRLRAATHEVQEHTKAEQTLRARSSALADILMRLEALRPPSLLKVDAEALSVADAESAYSAALEMMQRQNVEIGSAEGQLKQLQVQIDSDTRVSEAERELHLAYRREAIATASAAAFERSAAEIAQKLVEPIVTEVRSRWNQLFAADGLTFRPDGTIVRITAGRELSSETLSGGERIWARVVTHLLVLSSFTKLPFAWFDEPLEHLDPRHRHAVASVLATATQGGGPKQLVVTTYEDDLARRLADDTETASLVCVRSSSVARPPMHAPDDRNSASSTSRRAS